MPEVTTYVPGMLCWTDLQTSDQPAAKRFYSELFGWKLNDLPVGPNMTYTMATVGGKDVAAMSGMDVEMRKAGVPPHWNLYFAVKNVDEMASKAAKVGGKIVAPAFDVMDVGRMAVVQDPSGAMFCLWQAKKHIGAGRIGEPGAIAWGELMTRDVAACKAFYTKLFDWNAQAMPSSGFEYTMLNVGDKPNVGMMPMMPEVPAHVPSHWNIYFAVQSCDETVKRANAMGAKTMVPPQDIPNMGRFAMMFDPQGAAFAIFQSART